MMDNRFGLRTRARVSWMWLPVAFAAIAACTDDDATQVQSDPVVSAGKSGTAGHHAEAGRPSAGTHAAAGTTAPPEAGANADADAGLEGLVDTDAGSPERFEIALSTSACFGKCPVYDVSIDQAGQVEYDGHQFVAKEGKASKQVPAADALAVYDALLAAGYFELADRYTTKEDGCNLVTDGPTSTWNVVVDGKTKPLAHYRGCMGVPALSKISKVESLLNEKAGITEWLGQ